MITRVKHVRDYLIYSGKVSSQQDFAIKIGYKPTVMSQMLNGKKNLPSERIAQKICSVFFDINKDWLLTGEGSMLKDQPNQPSVQPEISAEENPSADSTLIAELRSQIEKLEAKVDNLNQELGEKNALIKMMSQGGSGIVQVADGSLSANVG